MHAGKLWNRWSVLPTRPAITKPLSCQSRRHSDPFSRTAVAVLALIRSKTRAFPLSTVIIEQYRPPVGKFVVGQPSQPCNTSLYPPPFLHPLRIFVFGFPSRLLTDAIEIGNYPHRTSRRADR